MKKHLLSFAVVLLSITSIATAKMRHFASQDRPVSGFNAITSSGAFRVYVKMDGTETLKIEASDDQLDKIETVVENGTLKIRDKKDWHWNGTDRGAVNVYITAKSLSSLVNSGSGSIKVDGNISASKFSVVLSGSGSITAAMKADDVSAVISGSGQMFLSGSTNDASLTISGSGSVAAKNLKTNNTHVTISGSGSLSINAEKELNSNIMGSGSIRYTGNARVSTSKLGSGTVVREN